jgi:poly-gamma-glutamate capsule biosynthesis protein CapA/YwtB (metallophosphatase superfamily)
MNTARLARKWAESAGDYAQMAEALGEEIDDPAAGLVTRDYLDKRLAEIEARFDKQFVEVETRIAEFEARFTWKIVGLLGVQIGDLLLIRKYL